MRAALARPSLLQRRLTSLRSQAGAFTLAAPTLKPLMRSCDTIAAERDSFAFETVRRADACTCAGATPHRYEERRSPTRATHQNHCALSNMPEHDEGRERRMQRNDRLRR